MHTTLLDPRPLGLTLMLLTACGSSETPRPKPQPSAPSAVATPDAPATPVPTTPATQAQPTPSAPPACPPDTTTQEGWPGEYPNPVVEVTQPVKLPASRHPCQAQADTRCTVSPGIYHPWSGVAGQVFRTVHPTRTYRVKKDFNFSGGVKVRKGDVVSELAYLAEGYCKLKVGDRTFDDRCLEMSPGHFKLKNDPDTAPRQFFQTRCAEGHDAWIEAVDALEDRPEIRWGTHLAFGKVGSADPAAQAAEGWIACMATRPDEAAARAEAARLSKAGLADVDVLWIPDHGSLSGAKLWLVYAGPHPMDDVSGAKAMLSRVRKLVPDAYGLALSDAGPRRPLPE